MRKTRTKANGYHRCRVVSVETTLALIRQLDVVHQIHPSIGTRPIDLLDDDQLHTLKVELGYLAEAVQDTIYARRAARGEPINRN